MTLLLGRKHSLNKRKKPNVPTTCDLPHVPEDLIINILSRLAVKDLFRFRSVCKSFYTLVTDPSFITKHTLNSNSKEYLLIIVMARRRHGFNFFTFSKAKLNASINLEPPFGVMARDLIVVGTCNGLVCLTHRIPFANFFILWNPATREYRELPCPKLTISCDISDISLSEYYGFGFDPSSNDYKLVRVVNYPDYSREPEWPPYLNYIQVYSKITNSWREIDVGGHFIDINKYSSAAVVSGRIHWMGWKDTYSNTMIIVCFDLSTEVFSEMSIPKISDIDSPTNELDVVNDSLSILVYDSEGYLGEGIVVWVMNEYGDDKSWSKQFIISHSTLTGIARPMGIFNDELVLQSPNSRLLVYDPKTSKLAKFPFFSCKGDGLRTYKESLVSVKAGV